MFDANATYIAVGELFFAQVNCSEESLQAQGVNDGDVILCSHISVHAGRPLFTHKTKIWTEKDKEPFIYTFEMGSDVYCWMFYIGRPDGGGFIHDDAKAKALAFMGGEWDS